MQHDYVRTQLRLPQDLHEQASKAASAAKLSLNELFLRVITLGLQQMEQQKRRLIYTQWNTKQDTDHNEDYLLTAANYLTDFLRRHPSYELVTVESLPIGLRCWYTYLVDENSK